MSQRSRVGQSSSNARRSFNRILNNVSEQCDKFSKLGQVLGEDLQMTVVFTTRDGFVRYIGSSKLTEVIKSHCGENIVELQNSENIEMTHTQQVTLPMLPEPVSQLNAKTLQNIIPTAMKNLKGGGYIKWGHDKSKPVWWPEHVVFANVKQRPKEQNDGRKWVDCLRDVLSAMFQYYGYDAETHVSLPNAVTVDSVDGDSPVDDQTGDIQEQWDHDDEERNHLHEPLDVPGDLVDKPSDPGQESLNNTTESRDKVHEPRYHLHEQCDPVHEPRDYTNEPTDTVLDVQRNNVGETQDTVNHEGDISVRSTPKRLMVHCPPLSPIPVDPVTGKRKRNWKECENDLNVRDFVNYITPKKKRTVRPRDIFTPSDY